MKLITVILMLGLISCNSGEQYSGQEIIDGKVSYEETSYIAFDFLYIQDNKQTKRVELPKKISDRFEVGDSCLLIIEKYTDYGPRK